MSTEERWVDRTGWPRGEWDNEPDRVEWRSEHGFPCLIVRGPMGNLCGYVGVSPGHPWYEQSYNSVEPDPHVHGGLTYSNSCAGHICHVPEPGEPDHVWRLGFDCAHCGDARPGSMALSVRARWPYDDGQYRAVGYVRAETERLAAQAKAAAKEANDHGDDDDRA